MWVTYVSLSAGIVIAIVAVYQLYRNRKIRQSELIRRLIERWDSALLIEARQIVNKAGSAESLKEIITQADKENSREYYIIWTIPNFFDGLGAMVEHGDLPEKIVLDLFCPPLQNYWTLYRDALTVYQLQGIARFQRLGHKALDRKNVAEA